MVAVGLKLNFIFLALECGSAGVKVTEGAMNLAEAILDHVTVGTNDFFKTGLPVAGVRVHDPMALCCSSSLGCLNPQSVGFLGFL